MSQTNQDDSSTDPPPGVPFTSESAAEEAKKAWQSRREKVLRDFGMWETWKSVPPVEDRDAPVETYLPGGVNYDD